MHAPFFAATFRVLLCTLSASVILSCDDDNAHLLPADIYMSAADDVPIFADQLPISGDDAQISGDDAQISGEDSQISGDDITISDDDAQISGDDAQISGDDMTISDDDTPTLDDTSQPTTDILASAWVDGVVGPPFPPRAELLFLPGGGEGPPVITSNNPEEFTGPGLLYGIARASAARGGTSYPLSGDFGVYLHHLNRSGSTKYITILVTNPNPDPVTVSAHGSGYNQTETGGLGLGTSPDFVVSRDWITADYDTVLNTATLESFRPLVVWQKPVNNNAEMDGRFEIHSSAPVYVYVVATDTADINDAVTQSLTDAPGDYRTSGTPPPPFGREAGVYAHDTWKGAWSVAVPAGDTITKRIGFMVNTATGAGFPQIQAFPALTHYDQSAAEAVGMYGNIYDLSVTLTHDNADTNPRQVRVIFASLVTGNISRYWDGAAEVNGQIITLQHTPQSPSTVIQTVTLQPAQSQTVHLRAMVPGLTSIPQALYLESF